MIANRTLADEWQLLGVDVFLSRFTAREVYDRATEMIRKIETDHKTEMEEAKEDAEANMKDLQDEICDLQGDKDVLSSEIEGLKEEIAELKDKLANREGEK